MFPHVHKDECARISIAMLFLSSNVKEEGCLNNLRDI